MHMHEMFARKSLKWSRTRNESPSAKRSGTKDLCSLSFFFAQQQLEFLAYASTNLAQRKFSPVIASYIKEKIIINFHNKITFKWETLIILVSLRAKRSFKIETWFNFKTIPPNEIIRWWSNITSILCRLLWGWKNFLEGKFDNSSWWISHHRRVLKWGNVLYFISIIIIPTFAVAGWFSKLSFFAFFYLFSFFDSHKRHLIFTSNLSQKTNKYKILISCIEFHLLAIMKRNDDGGDSRRIYFGLFVASVGVDRNLYHVSSASNFPFRCRLLP